jgi:hypothetical protein
MTSRVTPESGGREKGGRRGAYFIGERLDYAIGTIIAIRIPCWRSFKDLLLIVPILIFRYWRIDESDIDFGMVDFDYY